MRSCKQPYGGISVCLDAGCGGLSLFVAWDAGAVRRPRARPWFRFVVAVAGSIERVAGILIMVDSLPVEPHSSVVARWLAYWMVYGMQAPLPIQNNGALAALLFYCFVFFYLPAQGWSLCSVDAARTAGSNSRR